jgi:hypothetical protein
LAGPNCRAGWSQALRDSAQRETDDGCDTAGEDNQQCASPTAAFKLPGLTEERVKDSANSLPRRFRAVIND